MSERDLIIERLERKLAEKERELSELRRMMSGREDIEKLKAEIVSQIRSELSADFEKISNLESKLVELRRAIESLITEIAYIKGELKGLVGKEDSVEEREREKEEETYISPEPTKKLEDSEDDDILICD